MKYLTDLSEPPKKGTPITRARIKNLHPQNAEKLLNPSNLLKKDTKLSLPRKNPKTKVTHLTDPMSQKKQTEVEDENFFTDLSYPSGFLD